jgi:threonine/homoserine/homoserine lactone efflux protein
VGRLSHTFLAALALISHHHAISALLQQSAVAYSVVKYVGAAYLIYLGIRALMDRERFVLSEDGAPALGLHRVYVQAVASNVFNPKIAVFFLAYLPQFADPTSGGGVALQLLALAFAAMTWAIFSVVALLSGALGGWLRSKPRLANRLSWLTGGVLIALGLRLALPERR